MTYHLLKPEATDDLHIRLGIECATHCTDGLVSVVRPAVDDTTWLELLKPSFSNTDRIEYTCALPLGMASEAAVCTSLLRHDNDSLPLRSE